MSWEPINKNGSGSGDAAMANGLQAQPKSAPPGAVSNSLCHLAPGNLRMHHVWI